MHKAVGWVVAISGIFVCSVVALGQGQLASRAPRGVPVEARSGVRALEGEGEIERASVVILKLEKEKSDFRYIHADERR